MTDEEEPAPGYFGELGKLDDGDRLVVPAELRQSIPWLKGKKPIRLLAELREKGRIRLYPLERVVDRLAELRDRIAESHPQKIEALAAIGDRYREVSYYPSDTRVHLPSAIAIYLKTQDTSGETYYIECRDTHLDVMTLAIRDRRLKDLMGDLEIPDN